ncbi:MAG: flavocytochrome c [Clostridiales bacterium]|nr:flavocytochrome c [Candidatus Blautia equi]
MLPARMLDAQTVKVDSLTGATVSSGAIKNAVSQALKAAGCDLGKLPSAERTEIATADKAAETVDCDIVIVGAGGAGMTAAISAKQAGKNVIIVEKMPYIGGNTTKASGGMNAAGTKKQEAAAEAEEDADKKAALEDSTVENYIADTMKGGHDINDIELVTTMAENSSDAVDWLESIGAPLPLIAATGGTVHYYLHEPEDGSAVGEFLVKSYRQILDDLGIQVMLETKATEILSADGRVTGITAESYDTVYTINAKAVILATGGFGANFDMLSSFDPSLANAVTTNTPAATGDGIVLAQALGADTVDLEQIQLHPTVYQASGLLVSERLRSNGAILVNKEGKRFTNDLATRDAVSQAELQQTDGTAYIVYDAKYAEEKLYQKYVTNGITVSADTVEDLGKALGFDDEGVANFAAAVEDWNKVCAGEKEDEFGRNNGLVSLDEAPYTAIMIAPGIHHTMGGVKINTSAEVMNKDGEAIPGLFAAGEVTGGVHGGNRIGGNAVADIVVFGRIASESAVAYCGE